MFHTSVFWEPLYVVNPVMVQCAAIHILIESAAFAEISRDMVLDTASFVLIDSDRCMCAEFKYKTLIDMCINTVRNESWCSRFNKSL